MKIERRGLERHGNSHESAQVPDPSAHRPANEFRDALLFFIA